MSVHISKPCASVFYHLHNIGHIRKFLRARVQSLLQGRYVTPSLRELHWLLIRQWIDFNILLFAFKNMHEKSAVYIQELKL